MATVNLQGTDFTLTILPPSLLSDGFWVKTKISLSNEYVRYEREEKCISLDEMEEWIFSAFRLLAGAYNKERSLSFEKAGIAVDLYPYQKQNGEASREEKRINDCIMMIRLLMRTKKKEFLGGVYSLILHRQDIEKFIGELRDEFDKICARRVHGRGKYLFVGVSPRGYQGCNYWYLDPTKSVKKGDYVWVRMGRHDLEQIVYVDDVRYYDEDTAPYAPERVKKVLRKATNEELNN